MTDQREALREAAVHAALLMLLQREPRAMAATQFIRWLEQDGFTVAALPSTPQPEELDVERLRHAKRNVERRNNRAFSWDRDIDTPSPPSTPALPLHPPEVPMTDQREALREALLDIGTDHEGHRLRVDRADPDPELGPGHWLLVCDTDDESLLDFAALPSTPQPEGLCYGDAEPGPHECRKCGDTLGHVHTPTSNPGDLNAWCSTCGYFPLPLSAPPPPEPTE